MAEKSALVEKIRGTRTFSKVRSGDSAIAGKAWFRFQQSVHYAAKGHLRRGSVIRRYLEESESPRLHFGAGTKNLPGWLDSDVVAGDIYLDLTRPLPLPGSSFQYSFGEHVIEHLSEHEGEALLAELRRITRPGGVVRITTPDLAKIISIYEDRNPEISLSDYAAFMDEITPGAHQRAAQVFNDFMRRWGHRYVYDEADLGERLRLAGFTDVVRCEPGESSHALLRGIEQHGPAWQNPAEAMCLEATVPG